MHSFHSSWLRVGRNVLGYLPYTGCGACSSTTDSSLVSVEVLELQHFSRVPIFMDSRTKEMERSSHDSIMHGVLYAPMDAVDHVRDLESGSQ